MTLYKTMMMTKNNLVKSMYNKCVNDYTSLIYTNYCHRFYSVDIDFNVLSDSQCSCINMIYELRNVTVPGFNSDQKDFTVNYLSTCTVWNILKILLYLYEFQRFYFYLHIYHVFYKSVPLLCTNKIYNNKGLAIRVHS
jgi:hypothetical protein